MTDWDSDPDLMKIKVEFIDSLSVRLEMLLQFISKIALGAFDSDSFEGVQILVHKLAGTAQSFGFPTLTLISAAIDDAMTQDENGPAGDWVQWLGYFGLLEQALRCSIQVRIDPLHLADDPKMKELIKATH